MGSIIINPLQILLCKSFPSSVGVFLLCYAHSPTAWSSVPTGFGVCNHLQYKPIPNSIDDTNNSFAS